MDKDLELAKDYDFNLIEEFYEYIVESYINGNFKQVANLINQLWNRDNFINWLKPSKYSFDVLACYLNNQHS